MPRTSTKSATLPAPVSTAGDTLQRYPGAVESKSDVDTPQVESRMNQIARRAHELYEARGGSHGTALEDWLRAEREIDDAMGKTEGQR
jgi:hypothetical protein